MMTKNMTNFFRTGRNLFHKLAARNHLVQKVKYPKIHVARAAVIDVRGCFKYGDELIIGTGANLIVAIGTELIFGSGCYIGRHAELGPGKSIKIGSNTSIQDRCVILGDVKIGKYCLFSYNVYMSSGRHYFDLEPWRYIKDQDLLASRDASLAAMHSKPIEIEDDCWLGANVVVMPGVTIGKGSVIGANSVVTKDIEPYSVMAGAPVKTLRKRLNFAPPRSITCTNPSDWPYFYSGCETTLSSSEDAAVYGGITVENEFVLALDVTAACKVHLRLMCVSLMGSRISLEGGASAEIPCSMGEVEFKITGQTGNRLRFTVRSDEINPRLILQKAWVQ